MSIYGSILLIALIAVMVIDITPIIEDTETLLSKLLGFKVRIPKPFACSLCCSFWASVIYALCTSSFSLPVLCYALFISILTPVISDVVWNVRDFLGFIIQFLKFWRNV